MWAATPVRRRLSILRQFRHRLPELAEKFTRALVHLPRTPGQSIVAEVLPLADACRFLERAAPKLLTPHRLGRAGAPRWLGRLESTIRPAPLGLVLILGPSNYPLFLPGVQTLQALAAGNAVLLKPGAGGTPVARTFLDALTHAGLPPGLVTLLPEDPAAVGPVLDHAPLAKVFLTGSYRTGQAVLACLAARAIPAVVELSGCDAAVLLDTAPSHVDRFLAALRFGVTLNHGQTCIAPRRALVPRTALRGIEQGLASAFTSASARALPPPVFEALCDAVADARSHGAAALLTPMPDSPGQVRPILLTGVTTDMRIAQEDLFAPVLSLIPYDPADDLPALVNACPFALGASLFGPEGTARQFAPRLAAGTVTINDLIAPTADPRLPFAPPPGARSGFGSTRGPHGLLEMTTPKTVIARRGAFLPHLAPPADGDAALFADLLHAGHAPRLAARFRHALRFLAAAVRRKPPRPPP
jgi:acyl-CoA reductase-like NAD-dependent aldehyde dehydrogenase